MHPSLHRSWLVALLSIAVTGLALPLNHPQDLAVSDAAASTEFNLLLRGRSPLLGPASSIPFATPDLKATPHAESTPHSLQRLSSGESLHHWASVMNPEALHMEATTCMSEPETGPYLENQVRDAISSLGATDEQIDQLGWQDGAYVILTCEPLSPEGAQHMEIVMHKFRNAGSAKEAVQYWHKFIQPDSNEIQECDNGGAILVCVFGRSSAPPPPRADVEDMLEQIVSVVSLG